MKRLGVMAVGALVALAACSSGHSVQTTDTAASVTTEPAPLKAGTNKQKTEVEARRLLALVEVPPGAVRTTSVPAILRGGPAIGIPTGSPIDDHAFWKVPLSMSAALAWLAQHAPGGMTQPESASSATRGVPTSGGYAYDAPSSSAWTEAQVDLSVAPDGASASFLRADGLALWIDSRPMRMSAGSDPIRVLATAACPSSDRAATGVANAPAGLEKAILPSGTPTKGLICEYYGSNGRPFKLQHTITLGASGATGFADRIAQLPLGHIDNAVTSCPSDDGSTDVAALLYPGGRTVDLWMAASGCQTVSNGYILANGSVSF